MMEERLGRIIESAKALERRSRALEDREREYSRAREESDTVWHVRRSCAAIGLRSFALKSVRPQYYDQPLRERRYARPLSIRRFSISHHALERYEAFRSQWSSQPHVSYYL